MKKTFEAIREAAIEKYGHDISIYLDTPIYPLMACGNWSAKIIQYNDEGQKEREIFISSSSLEYLPAAITEAKL